MLQQCSTAPLVEGLLPVAVPKNVATLILSYMQPVDLLSASLVSKRWREYADSTELWARPEERSLLAIPLFKLSSANGVLLSYKLDSESGAVAECQKGSIFFDAGHTVEALVWLGTVRANASLSRHLAAAVCRCLYEKSHL